MDNNKKEEKSKFVLWIVWNPVGVTEVCKWIEIWKIVFPSKKSIFVCRFCYSICFELSRDLTNKYYFDLITVFCFDLLTELPIWWSQNENWKRKKNNKIVLWFILAKPFKSNLFQIVVQNIQVCDVLIRCAKNKISFLNQEINF